MHLGEICADEDSYSLCVTHGKNRTCVLDCQSLVYSEFMDEAQDILPSSERMVVDGVFAGPQNERLSQNLSVRIKILATFSNDARELPSWRGGHCTNFTGHSLIGGMKLLSSSLSGDDQAQKAECQELCEGEWLVPTRSACHLKTYGPDRGCYYYSSHDIVGVRAAEDSFCLASWPAYAAGSAGIENIFTAMPSVHLNASGASATSLDLSQQVKMVLASPRPFCTGFALFQILIRDSGGTAMGGRDLSLVNVAVTVLPVNSQPFADFQRHVKLNESTTLCLEKFATNVTAGGLGRGLERNQKLRFKFRQISGSTGIVSKISASCVPISGIPVSGCDAPSQHSHSSLACRSHAWSDSFGRGCASYQENPGQCGFEHSTDMCCTCGGGTTGMAPGMFSECASGDAMLQIVTEPHRFGTVEFEVALIDNGGVARGGVDTWTGRFTIEVVPVNTPPSFILSTDTEDNTLLSYQHAGLVHVAHFLRAVSMGPYESHTVADCPLGNCRVKPIGFQSSFTCSGSCACSPTSGERNGTFSDGSGNYENNAHCEWLISSSWDIVLNFRSFDTYHGHDIVAVYRCFAADCSARELVAKLSGDTVGSDLQLRSWTGFLQLVFTTSPYYWTKSPGFEAAWHVVAPIQISAYLAAANSTDARCFAEDFCENQQAVLELVPFDSRAVHALFQVLPRVDVSSGSLEFQAYDHAEGEVQMNLTISDTRALDGSHLATTKQFRIVIMSLPSFEACGVTVFEDSGDVELDLANVVTGTSAAYNLAFEVSVDRTHLFSANGAPTVDALGIVRFSLEAHQFGQAWLTIDLVYDSPFIHGRRDRAGSQTVQLVVVPVNDPPSFVLRTDIVEVLSGEHSTRRQLFADQVLAGPLNENCVASEVDSSCQQQQVTFRVTHLSQPDFFLEPPRVSIDGTLTFEVSSFSFGWVRVALILEDDGTSHNFDPIVQPCRLACQKDDMTKALMPSPLALQGDGASNEHVFWIHVQSANIKPGFSLNSVQCITERDAKGSNCSCPHFVNSPDLQDVPRLCTEPDRLHAQNTAMIEILEAAGNGDHATKVIHNFANFMSTAENFYPAALGMYTWNMSSQSLAYQGMHDDPVLGSGFDGHGLHPSSDYALSPDGRHVYVAEFETDTLAILSRPPDISEGKPGGALQDSFINRRSHGEIRLRFGSFWLQDRPIEVQSLSASHRAAISSLSVLSVDVKSINRQPFTCSKTSGWTVLYDGEGELPCTHMCTNSSSIFLASAVKCLNRCVRQTISHTSTRIDMRPCIAKCDAAFQVPDFGFKLCVYDSTIAASLGIDLHGRIHIAGRFMLESDLRASFSQDFIGQVHSISPQLIRGKYVQTAEGSAFVLRHESRRGAVRDFDNTSIPTLQGTPLHVFEITFYSNNSILVQSETHSAENEVTTNLDVAFQLRDLTTNAVLKNFSSGSSSALLTFNALCHVPDEGGAGETRPSGNKSSDSMLTEWTVLYSSGPPLKPDVKHRVPDLGFDFFVEGSNVRSNISVFAEKFSLAFGRVPQALSPPLSAPSLFLSPLLNVNSTNRSADQTANEDQHNQNVSSAPPNHLIVGMQIVDAGMQGYVMRHERLETSGGAMAVAVEYTIWQNNSVSISVGATLNASWLGTFVLQGGDGKLKTFLTLGQKSTGRIDLNSACGCPAGLVRNVYEGVSEHMTVDTEDACLWDTFALSSSSSARGEGRIATVASGCLDLSLSQQMLDDITASSPTASVAGDELCRKGQPGAMGLWTGCDEECCRGLASATVGLWNMHVDSMRSDVGEIHVSNFSRSGHTTVTCNEPDASHSMSPACSAYRPRSDCGEEFDTLVFPAGIRDHVNRLGAAVLLGPLCKTGPWKDWDLAGSTVRQSPESDAPIATPPSLETFVVSSGFEQALQFDGTLNSGLYITDDLAQLDNASLPVDQMSVEVWFTIEDSQVVYGGLVAAQLQLPNCQTGWSLGYSTRPDGDDTLATIFFSIALEGNIKGGADSTQQTVDKMEVLHTQAIVRGEWLHLVALYDGRDLELRVNNVSVSSKPACVAGASASGGHLTRSCGAILYGQEGWLSSYCRSEQTPLTLGTYDDRYAKHKFSHIGALKSARIFRTALSSAQVAALYAAGAALPATTMGQYWVKSSGRTSDPSNFLAALPQIRSPDSTAAMAHESSTIRLLGKFLPSTRYRVEFSYHEPSGALLSAASDECSIAGDELELLECRTPLWPHGFRAPVLSVSYASPPHVPISHWAPLWQKVLALLLAMRVMVSRMFRHTLANIYTCHTHTHTHTYIYVHKCIVARVCLLMHMYTQVRLINAFVRVPSRVCTGMCKRRVRLCLFSTERAAVVHVQNGEQQPCAPPIPAWRSITLSFLVVGNPCLPITLLTWLQLMLPFASLRPQFRLPI